MDAADPGHTPVAARRRDVLRGWRKCRAPHPAPAAHLRGRERDRHHTFTHPNLAFASDRVVKLQIDATERLLEAALGRRSAFFRPPYFGDAEPTTSDELGPVAVATERGYITVGLRIDAEDWQSPGVQTIIDTVLAQTAKGGNVVLLHDGGGERSQTVAALGPLIDSLTARGDTLVPVSELVGITRNVAMPPLPPESRMSRMGELLAFGSVGVAEWVLYWLFSAPWCSAWHGSCSSPCSRSCNASAGI